MRYFREFIKRCGLSEAMRPGATGFKLLNIHRHRATVTVDAYSNLPRVLALQSRVATIVSTMRVLY